jgi:hypothetical protein
MSYRLRVATAEERAWYGGVLYPLQDRVCRVVAALESDIVLTGGTALARAYLDHRYSDDLDFFSMSPVPSLARAIVAALERADLAVEVVTPIGPFVRLVVIDGPTRLQVDIATDHRRIDAPIPNELLGIAVPSLRDLAGNKLTAFEDRREIKDAIDLFGLRTRFSWSELFACADEKRVPIDYDALHHVMRMPLVGTALLTRAIDADALTAFLAEANDALLQEVKKKTTALAGTAALLVRDLLWDAPSEDRRVTQWTRAIVRDRARRLPLPARLVVRAALHAASRPESTS